MALPVFELVLILSDKKKKQIKRWLTARLIMLDQLKKSYFDYTTERGKGWQKIPFASGGFT